MTEPALPERDAHPEGPDLNSLAWNDERRRERDRERDERFRSNKPSRRPAIVVVRNVTVYATRFEFGYELKRAASTRLADSYDDVVGLLEMVQRERPSRDDLSELIGGPEYLGLAEGHEKELAQCVLNAVEVADAVATDCRDGGLDGVALDAAGSESVGLAAGSRAFVRELVLYAARAWPRGGLPLRAAVVLEARPGWAPEYLDDSRPKTARRDDLVDACLAALSEISRALAEAQRIDAVDRSASDTKTVHDRWPTRADSEETDDLVLVHRFPERKSWGEIEAGKYVSTPTSTYASAESGSQPGIAWLDWGSGLGRIAVVPRDALTGEGIEEWYERNARDGHAPDLGDADRNASDDSDPDEEPDWVGRSLAVWNVLPKAIVEAKAVTQERWLQRARRSLDTAWTALFDDIADKDANTDYARHARQIKAVRRYPADVRKLTERLQIGLGLEASASDRELFDPVWVRLEHGAREIEAETAELFAVLSGAVQAETLESARRQEDVSRRAEIKSEAERVVSEEFQQSLTEVATVLLVPTLICAIFGANVKPFAGADPPANLAALLALLFGAGMITFAVLRVRDVWRRPMQRTVEFPSGRSDTPVIHERPRQFVGAQKTSWGPLTLVCLLWTVLAVVVAVDDVSNAAATIALVTLAVGLFLMAIGPWLSLRIHAGRSPAAKVGRPADRAPGPSAGSGSTDGAAEMPAINDGDGSQPQTPRPS